MIPALVLLLVAQVRTYQSPTELSILAQVEKTIASNRSHPGDHIELLVLEDCRNKDGLVLIPAKAKLTGRVVLVTKHRNTDPGVLSFLIEKSDWPGGSRPLHATLDQLVVMGVERSPAPESPILRGQNSGGATGTSETMEPVPKDCSVESVKDSEVSTAAVCRKRDVFFSAGAQVVLADHPKPEP